MYGFNCNILVEIYAKHDIGVNNLPKKTAYKDMLQMIVYF